jgi:hypothetical protein
MELIPILSTIILVATMSTFILAIGAYVLYKVREKRGQGVVAVPKPASINAEVIVPNVTVQRQPDQIRNTMQPGYEQQQYAPMPYQQVRQGHQQPHRFTGEDPQYIPAPGAGDPGYNQQEYDERQQDPSKFMKYTSDGYVPTKDDKSKGALRWR